MVSLRKKTAVFPLLILLLAAALRLWALTDVPPGLTHDEADHGITAWSIVEGVRAIYFTIGYGREPFYDYVTAVLMSFLGPTYLAGRLTAVFFSIGLVAAMYAWARRAFGTTTALLVAISLATSFWPLMTGRQALRSTTLPTLFALAVLFFWLGLQKLENHKGSWSLNRHAPTMFFAASGLLIGLTFYTYIPARVLWGVFPATAVYLMLIRRQWLGRVWAGVLIIGLLGLLVAAPLLTYLANNPGTEVRIDELQTPLTAVIEGNVTPLLNNISASLRLLTREGDSTLRYNLPGRPFLQPIMGFLFYLGILTAVWQVIQPLRSQRDAIQRKPPPSLPQRGRDRIPLPAGGARGGQNHPSKKLPLTAPSVAAFLALAWLIAGFSPSLVTGPRWSMTQAIGMQPVLYLFPALSLQQLGRFRFQANPLSQGKLGWLLVGLIWLITAVRAGDDYFNRWANDPEVRVQYEATMVAAMDYLNQQGENTVAISTITPANVHTPALAQMTLTNQAIRPHWFDAQDSLLIPNSANSLFVVPGFTPLPDAFATYFAPSKLVTSLPLRETDLDRPLNIYQADVEALLDVVQIEFMLAEEPIRFGSALTFLGHDLQTAVVQPGAVVQLATLWQIEQPLPNAQLFTHILDQDGIPIAQADKLSVPGEGWQVGDRFIQLHNIWLGEETAVGDYPLTIGLYTTHNNQRQPLFINDEPQGDSFQLPPLSVVP